MQGIHRQIHTSAFFCKAIRVPTSLFFPSRCQHLVHTIKFGQDVTCYGNRIYVSDSVYICIVPSYTTLGSTCEVLVVKNTKRDQWNYYQHIQCSHLIPALNARAAQTLKLDPLAYCQPFSWAWVNK